MSPRSLPVKVKIIFFISCFIPQYTCLEQKTLCEQKAQLNIQLQLDYG